MNVKRFFAAPAYSTFGDMALLLVRAVAGVAFILHGWPKIKNPFGWMGPDASAPVIFQALAALSEFGGGLAWILGFLTPLASLGIGSTMAVAFSRHTFVRGDPFVSKMGASSESAAVYLCFAVLILALGPGRFSLDSKIFGRRGSKSE